MFVGIIGLFYLMSGPVSALPFRKLGRAFTAGCACDGRCGSPISIATSDAATIAIVVSAKARRAHDHQHCFVAVLKDGWSSSPSASTAIATATLGVSSGGTLQTLFIAIAISCVGGVVLGGGIHLYLQACRPRLVLF